MSELDVNNLRDIASGQKVEPSPQAWDLLNEKLRNKRSKSKIRRWRRLSVAAASVAVLSTVALFTHSHNDHNPELFAANSNFRPVLLEELPDTENTIDMYSVESVKLLKNIRWEEVKMDF